jgi:MOSC domain-containing protein YiiM
VIPKIDAMIIEHIFTSPAEGAPQMEQTRIKVVAGAGIEGDRYFDRHDEPGQNITLVEAEEIESFVAQYQRELDWAISHRNLVTRGVRLNDLVGVEFRVGDVKLKGVELCEPCMGFGRVLAGPDLPAAAVVKRFVARAGLRADVLSSGTIECGARIESAR